MRKQKHWQKEIQWNKNNEVFLCWREIPSYFNLQFNFDMYIPIFTAVQKIGENYNLLVKEGLKSVNNQSSSAKVFIFALLSIIMQIKGSWKSFLWIAQSTREKEIIMIKNGYVLIIT